MMLRYTFTRGPRTVSGLATPALVIEGNGELVLANQDGMRLVIGRYDHLDGVWVYYCRGGQEFFDTLTITVEALS